MSLVPTQQAHLARHRHQMDDRVCDMPLSATMPDLQLDVEVAGGKVLAYFSATRASAGSPHSMDLDRMPLMHAEVPIGPAWRSSSSKST
jgi:hypothetical protein